MSRDEAWMREALALAGRAEAEGEVPVGAIVVRDGAVLGEGWNRPIAAHDPTAHAEILALRAAAAKAGDYRLGGATLYVTLEPCPMCAAAHAWVGLGPIVYVASSAQLASWLGEWGAPAAPVRPLPIGQVAPGVVTHGPVDDLVPTVRELHRRAHERGTSN